ncbi:Uncharacterised protein [Yersinia enterocolitica]|nr:Uncharacterised protein [Yersinia enterocolitica]
MAGQIALHSNCMDILLVYTRHTSNFQSIKNLKNELLRFYAEPFFINCSVSAVFFQGFQRSVNFFTQVTALWECNTILLSFNGITHSFELAITGSFDEVKDVWCVMQNSISIACT